MSDRYLKSSLFKTLLSLMFCSVLASMAVLGLSSIVRAGPVDNLTIQGTVYDSGGSPLDGADVVVTDTTTHVSLDYVSFAGGFYTLTFSAGDWGIGDTIRVVANVLGEEEKVNSSEVPADIESDSYAMTIDVHFGTAIPQLGSSVGMMIAAGLVGLVAVVAVGVRRR